MKTELINIDEAPKKSELEDILGNVLYEVYQEFVRFIEKSVKPDVEIWDKGGRRGRYFQSFRNINKEFIIDIYFISKENSSYLKVDLPLKKNSFERIFKIKNTFSAKMKEYLESSKRVREEYGGSNLSVFVDKNVQSDLIKIIRMIS